MDGVDRAEERLDRFEVWIGRLGNEGLECFPDFLDVTDRNDIAPAPEARHNGSPGRKAWEKIKNEPSPGGAALTQYVFRIKLHAVFSQERKDLILKAHLAMMCLLIANVSLHRRKIGRAHGKGGVSLLP